MHFSPVTYYTLGAVYPRERTRQPYPRRRTRRFCAEALYRRPYGPVYSTACTFVRQGEGVEVTLRVA